MSPALFDFAFEVANFISPEHLEIIMENAEIIRKIQRGGGIDFDFPFSSIMGGSGEAKSP